MVYSEVLGLPQRTGGLEQQDTEWIRRSIRYRELLAQAMEQDLENTPYGHQPNRREPPAPDLIFTPEELAVVDFNAHPNGKE